MDLNKKNVKRIRGLILFTAAICFAVMKSELVWNGILLFTGILKPFLYGAAIAFVLNIPMRAIEKGLFGKAKGHRINKVKRPLSILLALISVILIIVLVAVTVTPQVAKTMADLANKIPAFLVDLQLSLEDLFASNPQLLSLLDEFDPTVMNWNSIFNSIVVFLKNGLGSVVTSTVMVAGNIIGGVVNLFVSLIFSFYVLSQKEKLGNQINRIMHAYFNTRLFNRATYILTLLGRNFNNFITGQCMEAVILGSLFVVCMAVFQFPYAVLVGVLIAFTALIPIVGAFIGCFVGAFLILVDDPVKAVWFLILFVVLQQAEGNLIYPHVVGNSVGLPSIWVLAAVTVGGSLMGVVGMLIFIPIVSTVYALVREDVNMKNKMKLSRISEPVKHSTEEVQEKEQK